MSTSTMTMPGSSTPACRSRSSSRSTSPFLAPPQADRPLVKRHHTLHTVRTAPYPSPSPPMLSMNSTYAQTRSGPSSPTLLGGGSAAALRRPGAPRRAHSFCGDASTSTFALASASAAAHLSANKLTLVAPPLERSLSSMGGRIVPGGMTMIRPGISPLASPAVERVNPLGPQVQPTINSRAPMSPPLGQVPSPAVPQILISPSISPPRPSLATIQHSTLSKTPQSPSPTPSPSASRSSTYIATPTSPSLHGPPALLGGASLEEPLSVGKENLDPRLGLGAVIPLEVEEVVQGVSGMIVAEPTA